MSPRQRSTAAWASFSKRHRGHGHLQFDPLYSVPASLIDALCACAPEFWSDEDVAFERDLTATASGGFFNKQPFPCPLSPPSDPSVKEADDAGSNMEKGLLTEHGLTQLQIDSRRQRIEAQHQHADLRALAYSGWLVTNSEFRTERDQLRARFGDWVQARGCFPAEPISLAGERTTVTPSDEACFLLFLRRWGLRTFVTWDLPQPMRPQTGVLAYPEAACLPEAGVSVFLPWYLLRDRKLDVHELTGWLRSLMHPTHLSGWLNKKPGKKNLGYVRQKNLFVLYRCLTLTLAVRYPDRMPGNRDRLDQAFGDYLEVGEDSVKKLRRELGRLL